MHHRLTAQNRNRCYFVGLLRASDDAPPPVFCFPFVPDLGLTFADIAETETELLNRHSSHTADDVHSGADRATDSVADLGTDCGWCGLEDYTVPDLQFAKLKRCAKGSGDDGNVNRILLGLLAWHERKCEPLISHYG